MKRRMGRCPACGGPVEFRLSTALVTICDFCSATVARGDKRLEDHGKVADLVRTNSPFQRGMTGKFGRRPFEIVGRVQYQHPAGGVWNEWYLQYPGDRVGWLADAQGRYFLTSRRRLSEGAELPDFASVKVGERVDLGTDQTFVVAEKAVATAVSADGNIPWAFRPQAAHRFADLNGPEGAFATIEFGEDKLRLFVGQQVSLEELHLNGHSGEDADIWAATPDTSALQISCPQCGSPLTLHAPETLRVACPACNSLLDCQQGTLKFLQTLNFEGEKPLIPLGKVGTLFGDEYTVIGFMVRYAVFEGRDYPWSEYLLYHPQKGFRWLVRNRGHWSFVEPLSVSAAPDLRGAEISHRGSSFRIFDQGTAYVRSVVGEFYWRVTTREQAMTADYIAPPHMLSVEDTVSDKGHERNLSLGTYVERETVEQAFGLSELPVPWGVGTIQPKPDYSDVWRLWIAFGAVLVVLHFVLPLLSYPVELFYFLSALLALSAIPVVLLFLNHQFEVNRWRESDFSPYARGDE